MDTLMNILTILIGPVSLIIFLSIIYFVRKWTRKKPSHVEKVLREREKEIEGIRKQIRAAELTPGGATIKRYKELDDEVKLAMGKSDIEREFSD